MCLICIVFLSSCDLEAKNCNTSPINLLIIGDSISTGYGLENYEYKNIPHTSSINTTGSYGYILSQKYNLTDTYHNFANDGDNSDELLKKLQTHKLDEYIKNADFISISIGGNDLIDYFYSVIKNSLDIKDELSLEKIKNLNFKDIKLYQNVIIYLATNDFKEMKKNTQNNFNDNFNSIEKYIHDLNPDAKIIFQTVFNPFSGIPSYTLFDSISEMFLTDLNKTITSSGTDNTDFIDVYSVFKDNSKKYTNILSNDIHPNSEGHKKIAELLDQKIK